jgi:tetratricopeptide (TPR) repeat protein
MSDSAERQLIDLVSREQRGLRHILIAGITTLVLVVMMSAGLGVYYYVVAKDLSVKSERLTADSDRLEKHAFTMRRDIDAQNNRVAAQEAAIRRAYDEMRQMYAGSASGQARDRVLPAVMAYLERGRHSLADERLIEIQSVRPGDSAENALLKGAAGLLAWERSGAQIKKGDIGLPEQLTSAQDSFNAALADPALRSLAQTGLAWISFIDASSPRSSYTLADCQAVDAMVGKIGRDDELGLQPLYWRAQCNRKLGRTREALSDYSLALNRVDPAADDTPDPAEQTIQMNAFHGLGTVLITTADLPTDAGIDSARALAERVCGAGDTGDGSHLMKLTRACLDKAIALRVALGQTENQQSGSAENKGFTYLRDGDFEGAFNHAKNIEKTGLFAWNELIRALSAEKVADDNVAREARRNVSLFPPEGFNACELKALMTPEVYETARAIISSEHDDIDVTCH